MDYFTIVNLNREPFSNSPDPAFFFESRQHRGALQKLELAIRLRRGLNVVVGRVGTGKTTLCRQLIRRFRDDSQIETILILDPDFEGPTEFLRTIGTHLAGSPLPAAADHRQIKETIKQALFRKGVEENKTLVLIIDEGQKLADFCLELLRECLNYETNAYKLLQIVIFAQEEFEGVLHARPGFSDRVNLFHRLGPLGFGDTLRLIRFRLQQASPPPQAQTRHLFTIGAVWAIYRASCGYPRQIIHLCHQCLLAMIIQDRRQIRWSLVRGCARRTRPPRLRRWPTFAAAAVLAAAAGLFIVVRPQWVWQAADAAKVSRRPAAMPVPLPPTAAGRPIIAPTGSANAAAEKPALGATPAESGPRATHAEAPAAAIRAGRFSPAAPGQQDPGAAEGWPALLGELIVGPEEVLSWLMVKIYGRYSPSLLEAWRSANTHINDPDHLVHGTAVRFPAWPVKVKAAPRAAWWVQIAQTDRLQDAVQVLRRYPAQAPAARIVGHWSRAKGLTFSVVLWGVGPTERSARERIAQLPAALSAVAVALPGWDAAAVFFADPYARGR
jgi:general secretion pathway protein A